MTTSPSEPVDNAQTSGADELPSSDLKDDILSDGVDHSDKSDENHESEASAIAAESTVTDPPA
jgi:hypothetical protein